MAERVLIVDDNPDVIATTRWMLETRGFVVEAATSGSEALEVLKVRPPSVVLLDVMMPGMSGHEVLETIRRDPKTAKLPVVLVTAKSGAQDFLAGYQKDADYYVAKPYSAEDLVHAIRLVLGGYSVAAAAEEPGKDDPGSSGTSG